MFSLDSVEGHFKDKVHNPTGGPCPFCGECSQTFTWFPTLHLTNIVGASSCKEFAGIVSRGLHQKKHLHCPRFITQIDGV